MKDHGKLFGIGVGPGDPELLTLKAIRVMKEVDVIFAAASASNAYSLAVDIALPHLSKNARIKFLSFPMTKDNAVTQTAWEKNAGEIAMVLKQGQTAAFLTLGDPLTYSTFGYVLKSLKTIMPEAGIETIPGITSFHAAAARMNRILVEAEQSLLITSGAFGGEHLRKVNGHVQNIVMMKAYKNIKDINCALKASGFSKNSVAVKKCGRNGEEIIENIDVLETRDPDYWTLILAGK